MTKPLVDISEEFLKIYNKKQNRHNTQSVQAATGNVLHHKLQYYYYYHQY